MKPRKIDVFVQACAGQCGVAIYIPTGRRRAGMALEQWYRCQDRRGSRRTSNMISKQLNTGKTVGAEQVLMMQHDIE
jgi:hypothetical protein